MKSIQLGLSVFLLAVLGLAAAPAAYADFGIVNYAPGPIYRTSNSETGRKEKAEFGVDCYDMFSQQLIDCKVDLKVLGLADVLPGLGYTSSGYPEILIVGGHMEDEHANIGTRPMFYPGGPILTAFNGLPININPPANPEVIFNTNATQAVVDYSVPELGGLIAVQVDSIAINGYHCAIYCFDHLTTRTIFTFRVGTWQSATTQTKLFQLPADGGDYVIVVNPSTGHRDLTAGDPDDDFFDGEQTLGDNLDPNVMPWFYAFAGLYHNDHTAPNSDSEAHRLSVNDASLPLGGLYDVKQTWNPPHRGHRDGWAIDLNKADASGSGSLPCDFNDTVIMEAQEVMAGIDPDNSNWEALVCEFNNNENYHLNLQSPLK